MGLTSPQAPESERGLQQIVDQQATTITKIHEAFAEERRVWVLEKTRFLHRIAMLEQLLRTNDHHRCGVGRYDHRCAVVC